MNNDNTIIRARAPLRLGLAGGGTDVSPYSDEFGGLVLNVTIDKYAYATIIRRYDDHVELIAADNNNRWFCMMSKKLVRVSGVDLHVGVKIIRESGAQRPVYETADQDFIVGKAAFPALKASRKFTGRSEFFLVINRKREKIDTRTGIGRSHCRGEEHRIAHADDDRAVGLLGQTTGLDLDCPAIRQQDLFVDYVHILLIGSS